MDDRVWVRRLYHAVTCTDTVCDPGCDVAVPALTGGKWWPELHLCPVLSHSAGFGWTVKYGPDGRSTCACRAPVPRGAVSVPGGTVTG